MRLKSVTVFTIAILSAAYSACAFVRYRAAWRQCRGRLTVPKSVELFCDRIRANDFHFAPSPAATEPPPSPDPSSAAAVTPSPLRTVSCPVAFVERAAFDANVRAVGAFLLAHGKQVRLATKSLRCPELLERAASILERLSQPCVDYEIIGDAGKKASGKKAKEGLGLEAEAEAEAGVGLGLGRPLVAGLLTSSAAETLQWARRGSFASLLLGRPVADAAAAERFVQAATHSGGSAPRVRCQVVVDAMEQLEFLWEAARAWITKREYARLGFDDAVESLHFSLLILADVSPEMFPGDKLSSGGGGGSVNPRALRTPADVFKFAADIEAFNAKIALERLPVGVRFTVDGVWTDESAALALPDTAPLVSFAASCVRPARWFLRYPLVQWCKRRAAAFVQESRGAIVEQLRSKGGRNGNNKSGGGGGSGGGMIVSGGCSAALVSSALDDTLTEVCVGAGLTCGHQLDGFADSLFLPALYFALTVTCAGAGRICVCAGFGQSLPLAEAVYPPRLVALPKCRVRTDEELETAVRLMAGAEPLHVGDTVVFRPARAGTLAELVDAFLLVSDTGEVEASMRTYRGEGWNLWS